VSAGSEAAAATLERAVALARFSGLETLDPALRTTLAARAELRHFAAGARLASDPARPELHLVLAGRLRERTLRGGTRDVGAGGMLGDLAALGGAARPFDATALVASETVAIGLEDLLEVCEDHFAVLVAVMRSIARAALDAEAAQRPPRPSGRPPSRTADRDAAALDLAGRIELLAECPMLAGVAVQTLGQLAQEAKVVELARGEVLWEEGDAADRIVAVAGGELVDRTRSGRRVVRAGELAGLLEALAGVPRPGRAEAGRALVALSLDAALLVDAMEDDADTAVDVLVALGGALAEAGR
jgi:CRP-like cAMP-binding protein